MADPALLTMMILGREADFPAERAEGREMCDSGMREASSRLSAGVGGTTIRWPGFDLIGVADGRIPSPTGGTPLFRRGAECRMLLTFFASAFGGSR